MLQKIKKLQEIEPSDATLASIKATIDARTLGNKSIPSPYTHKKVSYPSLVKYSTLFFIVLFIFIFKSHPEVQNIALLVKLTLSPNAHTRSLVALNALKEKSKESSLVLEDPKAYTRIENTLATSRKTLDTLQLMGEEGLYTMQECLEDYEEYYKLVSSLEKTLKLLPSPKNEIEKTKLLTLTEKVHDALEEAEERLGDYPKE